MYIGFIKDDDGYTVVVETGSTERNTRTNAPEFATALYSMMQFYEKMHGHIRGDPVCVQLSWHEAAVVEAVHELLKAKQINELEAEASVSA